MNWKKDWQQCKKILCVRPDDLGKVIMMTPVFRALKESIPGVAITLLTSSSGKHITPFIPEIDQTLVYDASWIERDVSKLVSQLKKEHFDGAILLTKFSQNPLPLAFLMYLAGIPKVLGYARELPNELINYWVPDEEPFAFPVHGVQRQLKLLSAIGVTTDNDAFSLTIAERPAAGDSG